MFDPETDTQAMAPPSSAFEDLTALLKLLGNDKLFQKRLDAFMAATVKFNEAKVGAERAQAALAQAKAEQETVFAKRSAEIEAEEEALSIRKANVDERYEKIDEAWAEIDRARRHLNSRMMSFAGLTRHPLQDEPTDAQIDREVFGGRDDVHYDRNDASTGRAEPSDETEPAPDRVEGSNLTRRSPRPPKPSRADLVRGA